MTLVEQPTFAESDGILSRLYETYDLLLECVAPDAWPAGPGGRRIPVGMALEPTVRHALDQALHRIRDTPACKRELAALANGFRSDATLAAEEERAGIRQVIELPGHRVHLLMNPALPATGHQEFDALFRRHLSAGQGADPLTGFNAEQVSTVHGPPTSSA
ncbi:hypothetical protein ACFVY4_34740 [Streptomyces sp. NPDC058299]|uniref:hypothetical protein n=1 Tax=Streptomyces sp. NPDC058299 TaxID=3346435 RepID=UPI0036E17E0F